MKITSSKYGPIHLEPVNADSISGYVLPGSKVLYCETEFGAITVHQLITDHFSLRYSIFALIEKVALLIQEEAALLRSQFVLKGKVRVHSGKDQEFYIREGQFLLFNEEAHNSDVYIENEMEHRLFDATYSYEFVHSLLQAFPSLEAFINKKEQSEGVNRSNKAITGSPEMSKIVFDLLKCPYNEALRKIYFENKVNDFLFEALIKTFNNNPNKSKTLDKERDSLFIARDLILADITKHLTIKELSQKINLNELKLKTGFKEVFGMGPFEFLIQARMEKARELLLETDKPMKEIAALTGFEFLTNFIAAFKKYFGHTPGELRRN